jgi:uncharacterized protein
VLASSVPFEPKINKLAGSLEMQRNTLTQFIYYLAEAGLLSELLDNGKSYSTISKPEKIYIDNPNLIYMLTPAIPNSGTLREVFFMNQMKHTHKVNNTSKGDYIVDNTCIFEIGGKNKSYKQIADIENSYIIRDEIISGVKNKIPLWLLGFMY